jgi:hypothetical protein
MTECTLLWAYTLHESIRASHAHCQIMHEAPHFAALLLKILLGLPYGDDIGDEVVNRFSIV